MTLTFIPKIVVMLVVVAVSGSFMGAHIYAFTELLYSQIRVRHSDARRGRRHLRASQALHGVGMTALQEISMADVTISALPAQRRVGTDVGFAVGIVAIVTMLIMPVPTVLIDMGLAFSIALSALILMVALWIQRPLDFSAFPTVLLIATILRLALNVATTRVILSRGGEGEHAAGYVVAGFSSS